MSTSLSNGLDREKVFSRLAYNITACSQVPQQQFIEAMHQAGIVFQGNLIPDGNLHRFQTGTKNKKDGWYVFYGLAGAFGDWSRDIRGKWGASREKLSEQEKNRLGEQVEKSLKSAQEERDHRGQEAAAYALNKWHESSERGHSDYLERKKVEPFGIRFNHDSLVIQVN